MSDKKDWYKCINTGDKGECMEHGWVEHGHTPTRLNTVKSLCPYSSDGHHTWQKIPGNQNIKTDLTMYPADMWDIEK